MTNINGTKWHDKMVVLVKHRWVMWSWKLTRKGCFWSINGGFVFHNHALPVVVEQATNQNVSSALTGLEEVWCFHKACCSFLQRQKRSSESNHNPPIALIEFENSFRSKPAQWRICHADDLLISGDQVVLSVTIRHNLPFRDEIIQNMKGNAVWGRVRNRVETGGGCVTFFSWIANAFSFANQNCQQNSVPLSCGQENKLYLWQIQEWHRVKHPRQIISIMTDKRQVTVPYGSHFGKENTPLLVQLKTKREYRYMRTD